jgi:deoxyribonuclease I
LTSQNQRRFTMKACALLVLLVSNVLFASNQYYPAAIAQQFNSKKVNEKFVRETVDELAKKATVLGYDRARKFLYGVIHAENDNSGAYLTDVYCGRKIALQKTKEGYSLPKDANINCEHTWPQSKFNPSVSTEAQKSDLHHLFPSDMNANSMRGNHPFGETMSNDTVCGNAYLGEAAPIQSRGAQYFEPPHEFKGNVARALFYFSIRYKLSIDPIQERYLRHWNELDPVDHEEMERNDKVEEIQGNRNPFIDYPELSNQVKDF